MAQGLPVNNPADKETDPDPLRPRSIHFHRRDDRKGTGIAETRSSNRLGRGALGTQPDRQPALYRVLPPGIRGPDVIVSSTDHTLRAALLKAVAEFREKIDHRNLKRARRREEAPAIELTRRRPSGGQRH